MTAFSKGDKVEALVDAQGMRKGWKYQVAGTRSLCDDIPFWEQRRGYGPVTDAYKNREAVAKRFELEAIQWKIQEVRASLGDYVTESTSATSSRRRIKNKKLEQLERLRKREKELLPYAASQTNFEPDWGSTSKIRNGGDRHVPRIRKRRPG